MCQMGAINPEIGPINFPTMNGRSDESQTWEFRETE